MVWGQARLTVVSEWLAIPKVPLTEGTIGAAEGRIAAVEVRLPPETPNQPCGVSMSCCNS